MKRTLITLIAAAAAGALAAGAVQAALGNVPHSSTSSSTQPSAAESTASSQARSPVAFGGSPASAHQPMLTPELIYRRDAPGVVLVTASHTQTLPGTFFSPPMRTQVSSLGSGFVVDTKGDIVTNDHVVAGATTLRVGFSGTATYPATPVGRDPSTDLAVIRVKAAGSALHPLSLGDSATLQVGDPVYAIGNPFGLDRTLTAGIVSATGRDIESPNGLSIGNAIQTDAAINHGNSGGLLLDRYGHVIGVNAQIETGGSASGNVGIGFAVPSDTARVIVPQLIARGQVEHARLGVTIQTIDPAIASVVEGVPAHGVLLVDVARGSPAAKAGLRAGTRQITVDGETAVVGGDTIVSIDGKPVDSAGSLTDNVSEHRPGDQVALGVVRQRGSTTVVVKLGTAPAGA